MPINVTDALTYTPTVQSVADGDAATQANVLVPVQGLANRTAFLKNLVNVTGVTTLRTVADLTTLAAMTGMADKDTSYVTGRGLYRYSLASGATANSPFVIAAAGGGRWFIDMPNGLIGVQKAQSVGTFTNSSAFVDAAGYTVSFPAANVGDLIFASSTFSMSRSAIGLSYYQLAAVDGGVTYAIPGTLQQFNIGANPTSIATSISGIYVVTVAGSVSAKLQIKSDGTASTYTANGNGDSNVIAMLIRP